VLCSPQRGFLVLYDCRSMWGRCASSILGLRAGAVSKFLRGIGVVEVRSAVGILRQLWCGDSPWLVFGVTQRFAHSPSASPATAKSCRALDETWSSARCCPCLFRYCETERHELHHGDLFAIKEEEIFHFFMKFLLTAQEYVHYRRLSW
jgi:hypothetical protein